MMLMVVTDVLDCMYRHTYYPYSSVAATHTCTVDIPLYLRYMYESLLCILCTYMYNTTIHSLMDPIGILCRSCIPT